MLPLLKYKNQTILRIKYSVIIVQSFREKPLKFTYRNIIDQVYLKKDVKNTFEFIKINITQTFCCEQIYEHHNYDTVTNMLNLTSLVKRRRFAGLK